MTTAVEVAKELDDCAGTAICYYDWAMALFAAIEAIAKNPLQSKSDSSIPELAAIGTHLLDSAWGCAKAHQMKAAEHCGEIGL